MSVKQEMTPDLNTKHAMMPTGSQDIKNMRELQSMLKRGRVFRNDIFNLNLSRTKLLDVAVYLLSF